MASKTYSRPIGQNGHTQTVTVERLPGLVIEHPSDTIRGGDYGRKYPTRRPRTVARQIGRQLKAQGWTEVPRG